MYNYNLLYIKIENIAYYTVAIFIATVIAVPSRAMHQITYPITAKLMAENKHDELNELYKKTSITLQIIGGLVLVGILVNINQMYLLLPKNYSTGIFVVFTIGISKYFDLILGNNNAIIFNSKYYKAVLFLGLLLAFLAITFLQSGYDKIADWNGNVSWLKGHFSQTFLKNQVPAALLTVLALEIVAGVLSIMGIAENITSGRTIMGDYACMVSCVTLLLLLFGQRVAKDYDGARTIVIYLIPALLGVYWL
jgi:uncharacterized membrane protein YphA (DoxX/SURF4 family)